jgi:ribosomal protein S19
MEIRVKAGADGEWLGDFSPTRQITPHNIPKSGQSDFASASS